MPDSEKGPQVDSMKAMGRLMNIAQIMKQQNQIKDFHIAVTPDGILARVIPTVPLGGVKVTIELVDKLSG